MPEGIEFDVQGATAAIENAGGLNHLMEGGEGPAQTATPTPDGSESATPTAEQGQLRDPVTGRWVSPGQEVSAQQPTQESSDAFTNVDPNTLSPELQAIYKSLQGDYTRKTQEIAQQRKLIEELGGQDQILQAAQLYQSLQNPSYWGQLASELKENMEQLGIPSPWDNIQPETVATPTPSDPNFDWSDPDLAPLKSMYDELKDVKETLSKREEAEQQERLQMALVGELQRQENVIRQSNPNYTDQDIDSIYELSSYYQGNLMEAQKRYEAIVQSRLERFLEQKSQAVGAPGVGPVPGGQTFSAPAQQQFGSLDEAHLAAMERLRQMEAGEL